MADKQRWFTGRLRGAAGRSWSALRSALGGPRTLRGWILAVLALLGGLLVYYVLSDRYAPLTVDAYLQAYVVEVAPQVGGRVVRVHVRENDRVRAGDLLFEIDPRPFEHKVARLEAALAEATQQVAQLESDLAIAHAEHQRLAAEEEYARAVHAQEEVIYKRSSTTERKYLDAVQKYKAAQAAVEQSRGAIEKSRQALAARVADEHALIAKAKAELALARLEREYAKVHAPSDGIVTDLQLRAGAYAHVGQAVLSLIETSEWLVVANFRETTLERVEIGQPALVSLRSRPGRLYRGEVRYIGWGVAHGQGVPSGKLPAVHAQSRWLPPSQRFQVRIAITDPDSPTMRVGATAIASIYTEPDGAIAAITRAYHQVLSWLDWLY